MKRIAIATAVAVAGLLAGCTNTTAGHSQPATGETVQLWVFSNQLDQAGGFPWDRVVHDMNRFAEVGRSMCDGGPVIPYFREVGWPTSTDRTTTFIDAARAAYCPEQR